jgi:RNA polymerase sporulation-specific sigma factor
MISIVTNNKINFKIKSLGNLFLYPANEVHYIGGAEILPPPLEADEENELLERMQDGDDLDTRKSLIEHNLRLVVYIAKKFDNTGIAVEDLISIGTIGLIKAINTFRIDRNIKLATYASRCIENEILMHLRRNARSKTELSIDEPLNVDWDGNELLLSDILGTDEDMVYRDLEDELDLTLLEQALTLLSDKERMIIELRFGLGDNENELTQKEVADLLGISQSYISRLEKKIIKRLKREINKLSQ